MTVSAQRNAAPSDYATNSNDNNNINLSTGLGCSSEHTASTMNTCLDEDEQESHHLFLRRQMAKLAGEAAKKRLDEARRSSRLVASPQRLRNQPMLLSWDDFFAEDMLGMGGFASVCLVKCPKLRSLHQRQRRSGNDGGTMIDDSCSLFSGSMTMQSSCGSTTTMETHVDPDKYYACKSLSNKTSKQANVRGFIEAAADLVHESFLLSHIRAHPNVVRLYGVPKGGVDDAFNAAIRADSDDLGYFLVMEALTGGILNDRIGEWRTAKKSTELQRQRVTQPQDGSLESFLGSQQERDMSRTRQAAGDGSRAIPRLAERLDIALQVATGMQHLHSHRIVFRDLKPHNVGLSSRPATATDEDGDDNGGGALTWRLFDFGLAREAPAYSWCDIVVPGKAGSLRYMSPETMGGRYLRRKSSSAGCFSTFASDVFSFAVLLWELVSLAEFDGRFDGRDPEYFEAAVCEHGYRPNINAVDESLSSSYCGAAGGDEGEAEDCLSELKDLIESCWHEDCRQRPTFEIVIEELQELMLLATSSSHARQQQRQHQPAPPPPLSSPSSARRRIAKENHRSPRNSSRRGGGGTNRRRSLALNDLVENVATCDDGEQQDQSVISMMDGSLLSLMNESVITMGSRSMHKSRHSHSVGGALSAFLNHDASRADQESDDEDESMMLM